MTNEKRQDMIMSLPNRPAHYNDKLKFKDFELFILGVKGFIEVTEPLEVVFERYKALNNTFAVRITDLELHSKVFISRSVENDFTVREKLLMNTFYLTSMSESANKALIQGVDELIKEGIKKKSFELVQHHWDNFKNIAMQEGTGMKFAIAASLCYFFGDFENTQTATSNMADYIQATSIDASLFFCAFVMIATPSTPLSKTFSLMPLIEAVK